MRSYCADLRQLAKVAMRRGVLGLAAGLLTPPSLALGQALALQPVISSGLERPLYVTSPPGDNSRLFIVEQGPDNGTTAQIKVLDKATRSLSTFLTVTGLTADGNEQGLLGMAFHPDYAANGRFFVNLTAPGGAFNSGITEIREYAVSSANPNAANPAVVQTLLRFDQPQRNHNGGWLGFSPRPGDEGNLYIATGDGGGADDDDAGHNLTIGNGQDRTTLLGKMLRINVNRDDFPSDPARNYGIPDSNPFASGAGGARPEIFNMGLRNPFRASFDRTNGNMFIGDVGQVAREELDFQPASNPGGGENYGWRVREGSIPGPHAKDPVPPGTVFVEPVHDYGRLIGATIIGGYVYRGQAVPELIGQYVFGDFISGRVFAASGDPASGPVTVMDRSAALGSIPLLQFGLTSFGEDAGGELYVVDRDGAVFQIVPEPSIGLAGFGLLSLLRKQRRQP